MNNTTANPVTDPADTVARVAFDKRDIKAKRILLDAIKDHAIPHISSKYHAHQMWTALTNLSIEKLKRNHINKGENMTTYLTRIT